uniref:Uncharacterized protein n=1 Tax=Astyanax mexicanus TaxID=7994 RepID=A0A8B9LZI7_ASTMX
MLTDEVSQIQEVRYCLKTLREQMAARHNNNNNKVLPSPFSSPNKVWLIFCCPLQAENRESQLRLRELTERVQRAEKEAECRGQNMEKLQRLLASLEVENASLCDKLAAGEAELQKLRKLEKELAAQKEKNHHLDDMLKSQQRKVRHMIEQLQNSRTMLDDRDRVIDDLEEKVAFLDAEVSVRVLTGLRVN